MYVLSNFTSQQFSSIAWFLDYKKKIYSMENVKYVMRK